CGKLFERRFTSMNEKVELRCPECHSPSLERVISRVNFITRAGKAESRPKVTTKSCSPGSNCMTLDIPGPDE
ncbi:MAG: zinc ribbon domain-containing protein, partial [Moorella sp. (in: Bacteria)]|nr:zinc ribbon domain-containing protein [Moorella sp. (in: firmicutes)]